MSGKSVFHFPLEIPSCCKYETSILHVSLLTYVYWPNEMHRKLDGGPRARQARKQTNQKLMGTRIDTSQMIQFNPANL